MRDEKKQSGCGDEHPREPVQMYRHLGMWWIDCGDLLDLCCVRWSRHDSETQVSDVLSLIPGDEAVPIERRCVPKVAVCAVSDYRLAFSAFRVMWFPDKPARIGNGPMTEDPPWWGFPAVAQGLTIHMLTDEESEPSIIYKWSCGIKANRPHAMMDRSEGLVAACVRRIAYKRFSEKSQKCIGVLVGDIILSDLLSLG